MLLRLHPRSLWSNVVRGLRTVKNWDPVRVERLEVVRRFPFPAESRRRFEDQTTFLAESQRWSAERLHDFQQRRLSSVLSGAARSVPYYRDLFAELGASPSEITLESLSSLPFLTRSIVEAQYDRLTSESIPPGRRQYFTTGGSTGIPLRFNLDAASTDTLRDAFFARMWGWMGYRPWERGAILRGIPIDSDDPGAYFDYDVFQNKLLLSSYHLREDWLLRLYRTLEQFQPKSLQAYPSAATMLAHFMRDRGLPPIASIRVVLCGSENVYPWQREIVERAFGCRLYSWYGHSENVLLGGECEFEHTYHMFSEHGVLELVRPDGSVITQPGEMGEIVGTGFLNDVMPFIRYRTGDLGQYAPGACACARAYPRLLRIDGRLQELIILGDGRPISMTAINMHSDVFDHVRQFQFEQTDPGQLVMRIVRKEAYTESDSDRILRELKVKAGQGLQVRLEFVPEIPPTARGKHRFLIQHLDVKFSD